MNHKKMDIKMHDLRKTSRIKSPDLRMPKWLEKRIVFRGYSFPLKNILILSAVLILLLLIPLFFLAKSKNSQVDPNVAIERETADLTQKIGKFMELPAGEQPTLATVTDRAKLKGQNFFESAQNGDKLLVYPKAKKAILFRPSTGKIIEVTHLTTDSGNVRQMSPDSSTGSGGQTIK
jgi:hypothetical protein